MSDTLIHHGIKGQIWGVRRYQNEDGSRTDVGRQHENALKRYNRSVTGVIRPESEQRGRSSVTGVIRSEPSTNNGASVSGVIRPESSTNNRASVTGVIRPKTDKNSIPAEEEKDNSKISAKKTKTIANGKNWVAGFFKP